MRSVVPRVFLAALALVCLGTSACSSSGQRTATVALAPTARWDGSLAPAPSGLPSTLQLGMADAPRGAAKMTATALFGYRYQYLAGGPNDGWTTWEGGTLVADYIRESRRAAMTPVFSYYVLLQSSPGEGSEAQRLERGLSDTAVMQDYFTRLRTFFQQASTAGGTVVLQVEPDLWGYLQQRAGDGGPANIPAKVRATGVADLAGLPDTAQGFAAAVRLLRDRYAPNVLLGYHLSSWGNGHDFIYGDPPDATVERAAADALDFYLGLGTRFDLVFAEFADRDAGFKQAQDGDRGASWFGPEDFRRHTLFVSRFVRGSGLRAVLWQIPYGNTRLRTLNNTWGHYQDNRVETLLDQPARVQLRPYVDAGVIALLFGRGADGATDASDAARDGVTNPAAISGNTDIAVSSDDDGGYFRRVAAAYYRDGVISLPR